MTNVFQFQLFKPVWSGVRKEYGFLEGVYEVRKFYESLLSLHQIHLRDLKIGMYGLSETRMRPFELESKLIQNNISTKFETGSRRHQ